MNTCGILHLLDQEWYGTRITAIRSCPTTTTTITQEWRWTWSCAQASTRDKWMCDAQPGSVVFLISVPLRTGCMHGWPTDWLLLLLVGWLDGWRVEDTDTLAFTKHTWICCTTIAALQPVVYTALQQSSSSSSPKVVSVSMSASYGHVTLAKRKGHRFLCKCPFQCIHKMLRHNPNWVYGHICLVCASCTGCVVGGSV